MFSKAFSAHSTGPSRRWLALGLLVAALAVAGCGSSNSGTTSSSSSTPATTAAKEESSSSSGIPQGEHAGDGDGDNHGEPSDGDGNL
jgi:hypothetical protein